MITCLASGEYQQFEYHIGSVIIHHADQFYTDYQVHAVRQEMHRMLQRIRHPDQVIRWKSSISRKQRSPVARCSMAMVMIISSAYARLEMIKSTFFSFIGMLSDRLALFHRISTFTESCDPGSSCGYADDSELLPVSSSVSMKSRASSRLKIRFGVVRRSASSAPEERVLVRCLVLQTFSSISSVLPFCPMTIPEYTFSPAPINKVPRS